MRLVFSLFLVFLLTSCDDYIDKVTRVLDIVSLEVASKYDLEYESHGGHYEDEKAECLSLLFRKDAGMSLDEARKLFINIHKDVFYQIKKEETISPFIDFNFFTRDSLVIHLVFKNKEDNERYLTPYVGGVYNKKGKLRFIFFDEKTDKTIKHEESLEEAYRIVEEEEKSGSSS